MRAIHFLGIAMLSAAIIGCQTHPALAPGSAAPQPPASSSAVLAASTAADWREVPPEQLLVMTLAGGGRVLMELAPEFAPLHADNIRQLARSGYYDGLAILLVAMKIWREDGLTGRIEYDERSAVHALAEAGSHHLDQFARLAGLAQGREVLLAVCQRRGRLARLPAQDRDLRGAAGSG